MRVRVSPSAPYLLGVIVMSKKSPIPYEPVDLRHDYFMTPKERDEAREADDRRRKGRRGELPWQKKMQADWDKRKKRP